MGWADLSLVLDSDLGALEPESTHSNRPWGELEWPNHRAEAKRDLKIWLETDYVHIPNVAEKIRDTYKADRVYGYTSSAYTEYTTEAHNQEAEDILLSGVFATFGTDRLYVGFAGESDGLQVTMLDSLNAAASVLTAKYWGPTGWTSLAATDGTASSGKTFAQSGRITWDMPTDWKRRALRSATDIYFWVELSVSAALTAGTAVSQIMPIRPPDGLKRVCAFRALGYICKGLAAQAANPDYWLMRVNNPQGTGYWDLAQQLYTAMRDKGSIPIDLDNDETIEPGAGEIAVTSPVRIGRA